MPRTRSATTPKRPKQSVNHITGTVLTPSEQILKPNASPIISTRKSSRRSISVRCRKWIETQLSERPCQEYDAICENSAGEDDGEEKVQMAGEMLGNEAIPTDFKPSASAKTKVSLVCEWQRCNAIFAHFSALRDHVQSLHINDLLPSPGGGLYQCCWDLCSFEAPEESEFRRHAFHHLYHSNLKAIGESLLLRKRVPPCVMDSRRRNTIPELPVDWLCMWQDCKDVCFQQMYDFMEHLRAHVKFEAALRCKHDPQEDRQLKCGWLGCDKAYEKTGRALEHIRSHTQERMMACPNCGATFTSYVKFYSHFNRQGEEKNHQCCYCSKYFFNEELLTSHMYIHVNRYKCSLCDMTCPSPSGLASHVRYRHIPEKPFKCQLCVFACTHKRDLEKHMLSKHEKHVYECDEFDCGFLTESLFMMNKHDRLEHCGITPNSYGCHCCAKRFTRGYLLSQHLIKVHSFQLPSGHSRFTYCPDQEGIYRLQTMRIESLEVTRAIMSPSRADLIDATILSSHTDHSLFTYKLSEIEASCGDHKLESLNLVISKTPSGAPPKCFVTPPPAKDNGRSGTTQAAAFSMPELRCSDDDDDDVSTTRPTRMARKKPAKRRTAIIETNTPPSNPPQAIQATPLKSIQDFSVMKRYLHNNEPPKSLKKEITIEVQTVNASGDVIRMETISADEICVD